MHKSLYSCVLCILLCLGCSQIDCPLDNQVMMQMHFWNAQTQQRVSLVDTLTIYGLKNGTEHLLLNKGFGIKNLELSLNVAADIDTLLLYWENVTESATDTLVIEHHRSPHFESTECPATIFHRIRKVHIFPRQESSTLMTIDSIVVANPQVQYEDTENLKVYLHLVRS